MNIAKEREKQRVGRHLRIRKKVVGTREQPRMCVHRSLTNLYVQIIDDSAGKVLFGLSTRGKAVASKIKYGGNITAASVLGETFAAEAKKKG